jgi:hypothetical protein
MDDGQSLEGDRGLKSKEPVRLPPLYPTFAMFGKNVVRGAWCLHPPCTTYTNNDRGVMARLPVGMGQPIGKPRKGGEAPHWHFA